MPEKKWLIVFLIYADYRLQGLKNNQKIFRELEHVLEDFQKCTINEGVKIVVVFNSILFEQEGNSSSEEDFTYLFEVKKERAEHSENSFICIDVINNLRSGEQTGKPHSVKNLSAIFTRICKDPAYKAKHIMLHTWDHGSVFGIFKEGALPEVVEAFIENKQKYPITERLFSMAKKDNTISLLDRLAAIRSKKRFTIITGSTFT